MKKDRETGLEIAVIGMAGRFPGADNIDQYWKNLLDGKESITEFDIENLLQKDQQPFHQTINRAGVVSDIEKFDAKFFGCNPREAELMDPQLRVFLQLCYLALESAGYAEFDQSNQIGLFAASRSNEYFLNNLQHSEAIKGVNGWQAEILNSGSALATLAAYYLDLKGPAISVQTACSGSLVAIHQACRSILCGDCEMALAGGVSFFIPQERLRPYEDGMILSPDGHCRGFDQAANGTVCSSGAGVVLLKRLEDAVAANDPIDAIIKGSAVNNDGKDKVGFAAPSISGQARVIREALEVAEVGALEISYIEAHGTATHLGDPIEFEALLEAFVTEAKQFCALGSVKSNIGHTDAASGVAGFIKTALALRHKTLPAHLHFQTANPAIHLTDSPFFIQRATGSWQADESDFYAGVSSFGIGGTNAHVILTDAHAYQTNSTPVDHAAQLLCFSAKSEASLTQMKEHLLQAFPVNEALADLAYTLQTKRKHYDYRCTLLCDCTGNIKQSPVSQKISDNKQTAVFMFPGQGAQYLNMGLSLYKDYPIYKENFDECAAIIFQQAGFDLRELLFAAPSEANSERLKETYYAQIALFSVEYSLAKLWLSLGVRPSTMIGHSLGEYVVACLSGVFSLTDALKIICARARLVQKTEMGSMLAVALDEETAQKYLNQDLALAAINLKDNCVFSGTTAAITALKQQLTSQAISFSSLFTSRAYHSRLIDPVLEEFASVLSEVEFYEPSQHYVSCLTGDWIQPGEVTQPQYWVNHLRQTIRFSTAINQLLAAGETEFIEMGPGRGLAHFVRSAAKEQYSINSVASLPSHKKCKRYTATDYLLMAMGRLWLTGFDIDFSHHWHRGQRRISRLLPYSFSEDYYWVEPTTKASQTTDSVNPVSQWLYTPAWCQHKITGANLPRQATTYVILSDGSLLADYFIKQARLADENCVVVQLGECFEQFSDQGSFILNPIERDGFINLVRLLHLTAFVHIIDLWSLNQSQFRTVEERVLALLNCIQIFTESTNNTSFKLTHFTKQSHSIIGNEMICPEQAVVQGVLKVIPQEMPEWQCQTIDLDDSKRVDHFAYYWQAIQETNLPELAFRYGQCWSLQHKPLEVAKNQQCDLLKTEGVYLISGGIGHLGLVLAEYLAENYQAHLVLFSRRELPPEKFWQTMIDSSSTDVSLAKQLMKLQRIKTKASSLQVCQLAIEDEEAVKQLADYQVTRFGVINGFIHAAGDLSQHQKLAFESDKKHLESQFKAKIYGTRNIANYFPQLDFCLLCSSLSSTLGGAGFTAYAAANAYLDAYARQQSYHSSYPWLAVSFDGWCFDEGKIPVSHQYKLINYRENDAIYLFDQVFACKNIVNILVSTTDLENRYQQWVKNLLLTRSAIQLNDGEPESENINIHSGLTSVTEQQLGAIWQELLGVNEVTAQSDFFELGGHSLLALQLVSKIKSMFQVEIDSSEIFNASNIATLSQVIEQAKTSTHDEEFVEGEL